MDWDQLAPLIIPGLTASMCGICGVAVGALLTAGLALGRSWVDRRWRRQDTREAEERARTASRMQQIREYVILLHECVSSALGGKVSMFELAASGEHAQTKEWFERAYRSTLEKAAAAEALRVRCAPTLTLKHAEHMELVGFLEEAVKEWLYFLSGLVLDKKDPFPSRTKEQVDAAATKLLDAIDRLAAGNAGAGKWNAGL